MVSVGFKTDRGRQRQNNEDSLFVLPEQQLYIVADGVGGHNSGELASRMSVGYMAQYVAMNPMEGIKQKRELKRYFRTCFEGANDLVFKKAGGDEVTLGMATTTVLCLLREGRAFVVNVGDSRAYLIREGKIMQVTTDHTCVQELIDQGLITPEQAKNHP
ncbi:MAG: serine/threonine-protein phosphatase, partial [Firmicutes bacterium]|nr:serine/threonine-protein phosphatase [Bacillota bacterium]